MTASYATLHILVVSKKWHEPELRTSGRAPRGADKREEDIVIEFPIERGHIMMFARSVGDPNPIYSDPQYAKLSDIGHVIAPPTFVQASAQFDPHYSLRPRLGEPWVGSTVTSSGDVDRRSNVVDDAPRTDKCTSLHAEQHYVFNRHVVAGETLFATARPGTTWQREGRRGGTLTFTETYTDYRDASGEIAITARSVGVRTSQNVAGE